jgi:deoxyribodipyrimidine photo-lyase
MNTYPPVPHERLSAPSDLPPAEGEVVLYWMTAQRRARYNFGLQRALWWCAELGRPLVVLEALRLGYEWASDRHHAFVIDGMRDNASSFAAAGLLETFLREGLGRYHESRNSVEGSAASGLSAHIHFGHISAHEVVEAALRAGGWSPERVAPRPTGSREGWWGAPPGVESFLDEQITWRELGFAMCFYHPEGSEGAYDRYESLPPWALETLEEHRADPREHLYSLEELDASLTHDPLWNAAQRQLRREGRVHNYLRMLWGKKVLEWSPSPEEALRRLVWLNNRYALDGRDPNSYSGIFWCLGRFDRAWGPERPVYGKVRYMTSESTARKYDVRGYLRRYS